MWAPLGNSWYDSLQTKLTKRFSHGLDATVNYTRSKNLATVEDQGGTAVPINNVVQSPQPERFRAERSAAYLRSSVHLRLAGMESDA